MPGDRAPKVAYPVLIGRSPGIDSTWSGAEKKVGDFSHSRYEGHTLEDGGRGEAERKVQDFVGDTALGERGIEAVHKDVDEPRECLGPPSAEPGRVHALGYLPQPTTSTHPSAAPVHAYASRYIPQCTTPLNYIGQQLPTPPNTLIGIKRGRPSSWEAGKGLPGEAICMSNRGAPDAATSMKLEHTQIHITSDSGTPAKTSGNIEDRTSANELPLSLNYDTTPASEISSVDLISCESAFNKTRSNGHSDDTAGKSDSHSLLGVATDVEDESGASTLLSKNNGCEDTFAGKVAYPQLPLSTSPRCADTDPAVYGHRNIVTDHPDFALDHFSPTRENIPSTASSDYGDFLDDPAVLDHIPAMGPRTETNLCAEQLALVELIMDGHNVFYTGSAGCGKSTVLRHFIPLLRQEGKKVDVLAPTGRAALEVNGRTLYSYAGWVPNSLGQSLSVLENRARGKKVRERLRATEVLIIDEISMVANHVFERLNYIMKYARDSKKPFGGVQIIVTGDFCQLPPINEFEYCLQCGTTLAAVSWDGKYECDKCLAKYKASEKWAFRSVAWKECNFQHVNLNVIHRQKDADFKALLDRRRLGEPYSFEDKWLLLEHPSETTMAVRLFPRRADVKSVNDSELAQLPGPALTYSCIDNFNWNRKHDALEDYRNHCEKPMNHVLEALENHSFEPNLVLKEGMLVILLTRLDPDSSLANGSQGTIVGFEENDPELFPEVPRKWDHSSYKNGLVKKFVRETVVKEWPIVQFVNGSKRTIYPRCMVNELGDEQPYSLLSRTQIPLMAAWAMTIHKAQGMNLSRVIVDLSHSFEPGQDYVALSRAKTLGGLTVKGLPHRRLAPDQQVIEFLKENDLMPATDCKG